MVKKTRTTVLEILTHCYKNARQLPDKNWRLDILKNLTSLIKVPINIAT